MKTTLLIILAFVLSNCKTTYHTTKIIETKKVLFWNTYTLQEYLESDFIYDEYVKIDTYYKYRTRIKIDSVGYYVYRRKSII